MGRPRSPNHVKVFAGEREDRIDRGEPMPAESAVAPPVPLTTGAERVWDRLAPDLIDKGCLTLWDADLFTVFCESAATYHQCRERMGTDYVSDGGLRTLSQARKGRWCGIVWRR